ncbi:MAG: GNAT family N-acetyltransferase [Myxococcales bacterium]|nr:GNAT family N-acetyltransferase [Myxococcales bacterium]
MSALGFRLVRLDVERHAEALHAIFGDEESCRYLPRPAQATVADTAALIRHWSSSHADTSWAIEDSGSGRCLGRIQTFTQGEDVWEVACMVVPAARGRRLAERALQPALDITFDEKNARRIFADIDPDNLPCIRTFERLGFTREGHLRATYRTHIGVRDSVIFGMVVGDPRPWRATI